MIQIYLNLVINVLLLQLLFVFGINANTSQVLCKLLAILQHYLHLSVYLWLLTAVFHLYRMLTELRDINKISARIPVFYYVIGLGIPGIIVSLTLGIKQDIYTNFNLFSNLYETQLAGDKNTFANFYLSSVYCWLCVTNYYELFCVFLLPIAIICALILIFMLLCIKESRRTTFKKSDVPVVKHNLISCFSILLFQALVTIFLLMLIYSGSSSNLLREFGIYQYLYIAASIIYSVQLAIVLLIFNKTNRENLIKVKNSYKNRSSSALNDSLDTSKHNLYKRSPQALKSPDELSDSNVININDLGAEVLANINQQVFRANSKYMLDYRNLQQHTNSVSTTTTSGTLENLDDCEFQANYLKHQYMMDTVGSTSNNYMSHLANTTNTESTTNDSEFYSSRYNVDFNQPAVSNDHIRESDVIDVGKILKSRTLLANTQNQFIQKQKQLEYDETMMTAGDGKSKKCFESESELGTEAMFPQNYIEQFQSKRIQNEINKCYEPDNAVQQSLTLKKNQSLFWPNTVAECDTSYLEGSLIFTPAKIQGQLSQKQGDVTPEEVLSPSRNFHKNHSYNSNAASSNSTSYSSKLIIFLYN